MQPCACKASARAQAGRAFLPGRPPSRLWLVLKVQGAFRTQESAVMFFIIISNCSVCVSTWLAGTLHLPAGPLPELLQRTITVQSPMGQKVTGEVVGYDGLMHAGEHHSTAGTGGSLPLEVQSAALLAM